MRYAIYLRKGSLSPDKAETCLNELRDLARANDLQVIREVVDSHSTPHQMAEGLKSLVSQLEQRQLDGIITNGGSRLTRRIQDAERLQRLARDGRLKSIRTPHGEQLHTASNAGLGVSRLSRSAPLQRSPFDPSKDEWNDLSQEGRCKVAYNLFRTDEAKFLVSRAIANEISSLKGAFNYPGRARELRILLRLYTTILNHHLVVSDVSRRKLSTTSSAD